LDSEPHEADRVNVPGSPSGTLPPIRQELLVWFQKNAAPLAGAYEGAIRLLDNIHFPGRVHFIAHAGREIADRLVFVLDPQLSGSRVQYEDLMDPILKSWPGQMLANETEDGAPSRDEVTIDYKLATMIDSLVDFHRDRRQRPSASELLFRFLMRNEPSWAEVNQRLVAEFSKIRRWFMELTHVRQKKAPEVEEDELQAQFGKFERMLHSFVGSFFTGTAEIDEILRQANE
jgi:hypothetical protein